VIGCGGGGNVSGDEDSVAKTDADPGVSFDIEHGNPDMDIEEGGGSDDEIPEVNDADATELEEVEEPCLGWFGCPCLTNEQCQVGFCVDTADGKICTQGCIEQTDCPEGWACRQVLNTVGDPIFICIPVGISICRPCNENADCTTGITSSPDRCVSFGATGKFCGTACGSDEDPDCLEGYSCQDVSIVGGDSSKQCVPDDGTCECSEYSIQEAAYTDCFFNNEWGTCFGKRECLVTGLTDCSAQVPAREECNGVDDDCDGETDNEGSEGCVTYYQDNDLDGFGMGVGHCLCEDPGEGYSTIPGDCNDVNSGVHPDANEICNGFDDNCDDVTDPQDSPGCQNYSLDGDGDGWGVLGDTKCMCGPTPPYTGLVMGQQTDCDDANKEIHPEAPEKCDLLDNDCDGITDPENSKGCEPWYYDGDEDGFGSSIKFKCLCEPQGSYNTKKSGDCDDSNPLIHPLATELCDGKDQNCNGQTDEGDPEALCPPQGGIDLHGVVGCDGKCKILWCDEAYTTPEGVYVPGWYDNNQNFTDGCECQAGVEEQFEGGACNHPTDLGTFPDSGFKMIVGGNIVPTDDEDWYVVDASDPTWNNEPNNCDLYNMKILFTKNPDNEFVLDVYRGSCADTNNICKEGAISEWATNFYGGGKGECGCSTVEHTSCGPPPDYNACVSITGDPHKCNGCPGEASPGVNSCSNNSALFYIKVSRDKTKPATCLSYEIEVSNGLYPWSG